MLGHAFEVGFGVVKADAECAAGEAAAGGGGFAVLAEGCRWRGIIGTRSVGDQQQNERQYGGEARHVECSFRGLLFRESGDRLRRVVSGRFRGMILDSQSRQNR